MVVSARKRRKFAFMDPPGDRKRIVAYITTTAESTSCLLKAFLVTLVLFAQLHASAILH